MPEQAKQDLLNYLKENSLALTDIGISHDDLEQAFDQGTLVEKARQTLTGYGRGQLTKKQLESDLATFNRRGMGADIFDEYTMDIYKKWHKQAINAHPA
jgi:hypothetical protein